MKPRLSELAERYSVDKLHAHSYIPFYEQLFAGRDVRRLLEIGIGYEDLMAPFVPTYIHGASLYMWQDYFPDGSEDYDYCMRAKAKGYGFAVTEPHCVIHCGLTGSSGRAIVGYKEMCEQNATIIEQYGLTGKVQFG